MKTDQFECNFVGSFKVGDNLAYNCDILSTLVEVNRDEYLNKPIVLQVGSILEAALSQIIYRAQNFNKEGVPNIAEADRLAIEGKKVDKFSVVIDVLRKYSVIDGLGPQIYDDLHRLRKFRNKIHIQEDVNIPGATREEGQVFTTELCLWALDLHWRVISHLSTQLARPKHIEGYVRPLVVLRP